MARHLTAAALLLTATAAADAAEPQSQATPMSFEKCLATIRGTAAELGVAPINIVETNDLRMVRFCAADASVLVTCSRPDDKQVITVSPHRCE
jgi:hypothetical protein